MKPIITKFNDKTGDFEITIPVPFTLKDGIEYVNMMVADVPKYEDTKDYNVFDLIRENQKLKNQLEEKNNKLNSVLDYIDSNIFIEQFENVDNENNVRKEIIKRITSDKE